MSDVDVFEGWLSFRNRTEDVLNENIRVKPTSILAYL